MYTTHNDAETALINSGVFEMLDHEELDAAAEYMFRNDATPEQAAEHFGKL